MLLIKVISLALMMTGPAFCQLWSSILASDRAVDWSAVGATISDRSTICSTMTSSNTAAQINSAISSCGSGEVVFLSAGTYNLSTGLVFNNKSNVTLRGAGANQTILNFSGSNSCLGGSYNGVICIMGANVADPDAPGFTTNWTAGYSQNTSVITVASAASLAVGRLIILDQLSDSSDGGFTWVCDDVGCTSEGGGGGWARSNRAHTQISRITGISGTDITISPALLMPDWRSDQSPQVWGVAAAHVQGVGIEHMRINGLTGANNIMIGWAENVWVKGVMSTTGAKGNVNLFEAVRVTIRDSYFYNAQAFDSENYGVHMQHTSAMLIQNNIFQKIPSGPVSNGGGCMGCVISFNYIFANDFSLGDWHPGIIEHESSGDVNLYEGNDAPGVEGDDIHGTHNLNTHFRNFYHGNDPLKTQTPRTGPPFRLDGINRIVNIVGNVLGTNSVHTVYESGSGIYNLCGTCSTTLMRWGNYDTANDATRWEASEVPSGIAQYDNPVPSDQNLPSSFYLDSLPTTWWGTPWGTPTWPVIGPDVSGGNVSGWDGHVNKIPSRLCYENTTKDGNGMMTDFNASTCYITASTGTSPRFGGGRFSGKIQ